MALLRKALHGVGLAAADVGQRLGEAEIMKLRDNQLSKLRREENVQQAELGEQAAVAEAGRRRSEATTQFERDLQRDEERREHEKALLPLRAEQDIRVAEAREEGKITFQTVQDDAQNVQKVFQGKKEIAEIGRGPNAQVLNARAKSAKNLTDAEKQIWKMSATVFGSQLGDKFSFEGGQADKAAILSELTLQDFRGSGEGASVLTSFERQLRKLNADPNFSPIDMDEAITQAREALDAGIGGVFTDPSEKDVATEAARRFETSRGGSLLPGPGGGQGTRDNPIAVTPQTDPATIPSGAWFRTPDGRVLQKR